MRLEEDDMPDHRLAIVTGTSSGIGQEVATQLLARGWNVIGIARRPATQSTSRYTHLSLDLGAVAELVGALDAAIGQRVRDSSLRRVALVNNAADVALLGQVDRLDPSAMLMAHAVNTVAPVALMGWVLRTAPPTASVRIVNVSSGAAVNGYPGLGAYGASKAALRMAGMVLAAELDLRPPRDVSILSYEPGIVETPMQTAVRSTSADTVPIVGMFQQFKAEGQLLPARLPAAEIVKYVEGNNHSRFSEKRIAP